MKADKTDRIDLRVPHSILSKIDKYQQDNGIATRTAAILELVRKGLSR